MSQDLLKDTAILLVMELACQIKRLRYVFIRHFSKGSLQYPVIFSFSDTIVLFDTSWK